MGRRVRMPSEAVSICVGLCLLTPTRSEVGRRDGRQRQPKTAFRRRYRREFVSLLRRLAGSLWIRALVSVALLALVFSQIDLGTVRHRLAHGHWGYFAAAVAAVFVSYLIAAF